MKKLWTNFERNKSFVSVVNVDHKPIGGNIGHIAPRDEDGLIFHGGYESKY